MTASGFRLAVVYLPSAYEVSWRRAVTETALRQGWQVVDQALSTPSEAPTNGSLVIHCYDPAMLEEWAPDEIVVLKDDPQGTIVAASQLIADQAETVRFASVRLAQAGMLARGHEARLLEAAKPNQVIGALGMVEAGFDPGHAAVTVVDGPLSFYHQLPPVAASKGSDWPQSLFIVNEQNHGDYVDGLAVDLTGRRRLLQAGPAITLTPGLWEARTRVAVAVRSSPIDLRFEWGTGHDVAVLVHTVKTSGVYEILLEREWPSMQAAELRIWLDRAMFDGGYEFLSCEVRFVQDAELAAAA